MTQPTEAVNQGSGRESRRGVARTAWWLSTRRRRPEWQSLAGAGLATFSGRPRANFEQAQTGDPVLIYVARPDRAIRAIGIITHVGAGPSEGGAGRADGASPRKEILHVEVQFAFEVPNPLPWQEIHALPGLEASEPVRQRSSGTLFYLSPAEYKVLQLSIVSRNPELAPAFDALDAGERLPADVEAAPDLPSLREQPASYLTPDASASSNLSHAYARAPAGEVVRPALPPVADIAALRELTGLPEAALEEARDLLEDTGGIVLAGPPGTGKTWLARGLAALVAGDPVRVQVVQFHPATTYEDFIEGLKPSVDVWGHVTYAVMPGLFVRTCEMARRDPDHHYVLIIDEINRAPLARVFGELLYALEYRGPSGAVELSVSAGVGTPPKPFYVPENLLLVGTMNSADRSLALVDYALRRRFRFVQVEPNAEVLDDWLREHGAGSQARLVLLSLFREANIRLAEALDPDHRLGHSYFMLDPLTPATLDLLWRTAIRPLISEYFIPPAGEVEEYAALFATATAALSRTDG